MVRRMKRSRMYYESRPNIPPSCSSMISIPSNWGSLRTKITGLAIISALVCSVIFGLLIWATSISTAKLVGAELTNFMIERTSNGCIHGYHTSVVALGEVMDALAANLQTVHLLL